MAIVINDFVMNLPHEYYPAIGEFMFRCGQLEHQMHNILWAAIDLDPKKGRLLTIGSPVKTMRAMLRTSVSPEMRGHWIPNTEKALIQGICSVAQRSKEFTDFRNKIAHGAWQYPVRGKSTNTSLIFVKEQNEKFLARVDTSIDAAHIHAKCARLKSVNLFAKQLLIDLFEFRGWNTSHLHSRKNVD